MLHTLHYSAEVLSRKEINPRKTKISPAELETAISPVKAMAKSFNPEDYADEYQSALKQVVEAKVKGEKITAPPAPKVEAVELMAALRASLTTARSGRPRIHTAALGRIRQGISH